MNTLMRSSNGSQASPSFSGLVDKFFENNLNRIFDDSYWGFKSPDQSVPVNIKQTEKDYTLEVVAPGLAKEDFKINLNQNLLTVSFEHKEETNKGYVREEFKRASFSRSFNIDERIDANKINASYQDGILHLTLPIKEGMQPISRNIEIK